jgi:hypothetical protein
VRFATVCNCLILIQPERESGRWRFCRKCQARLRKKGLRFMADGRVRERKRP